MQEIQMIGVKKDDIDEAVLRLPIMAMHLMDSMYNLFRDEDESGEYMAAATEIYTALGLAHYAIYKLKANSDKMSPEELAKGVRQHYQMAVGPELLKWCSEALVNLLELPDDKMAIMAGEDEEDYHRMVVTARNVCMMAAAGVSEQVH